MEFTENVSVSPRWRRVSGIFASSFLRKGVVPDIAQKLQKMFPFPPMASGIGRFHLFCSAQGRSAEYRMEFTEK
ncbi:MAG: hypothetical protein J6B77_09985 [Clostridia bacterium]|nr:hypothetical protein [Clostridia bacterium]